LYAELEKIYNSPKKQASTDIANVLHHIAEEVHQRSLVIIFSDMLEHNLNEERIQALFAAIQHLKYNKHEVVIFNVNDKAKEVDFSFDNKPYHFIDSETGEELKVHPNKIRNVYRTSMEHYRHQLQLKCAQYQIDLVDANIHDGYNSILKSYLIKRNKMI
jgi:hypothetical protein